MAAIELYSTPLITDANLENYYRLDTTADSSGKGRTLTAVGSVSVGNTGGKFGNCAFSSQWDKTNHYYATTFAVGANTVSLGCWFLKNGAPTNDYEPTIMAIGNTNRVYLTVIKNTGYASFSTFENGNYTNVTLSTNVNICDNVWHLVVGVRDGTSVKLYVDGNLVGSGTGTARTVDANVFNLGQNDSTGINSMPNAYIDDAFVFSRALSATEISKLYNGNSGIFFHNFL